MLNPYSPLELERILREETSGEFLPKASNRAAWTEVARKLSPEELAQRIATAEKFAATPIPALPASLFLEYKRTGQREGYETPVHERRNRLLALVVGECLEGQGRFLDAVLDTAWAICEESAWDYPAHVTDLADPEFPQLDLSTGITTLLLAETDYLLGEQLETQLGDRIRYEINRRAFVPFLTRHDHWWLYQPPGRAANWTGVCTGGIASAAIYLEKDPARLAEILDLAARSLDRYLASFGSDGGSSEGPGYWSFGFSFFTLLAQLVEVRTNGRLNFFLDPQVEKAARFPLRTRLSPQNYVNFSDCDREVSMMSAHLAFLAGRLNIPELKTLKIPVDAATGQHNPGWGLRTVAWKEPASNEPEVVSGEHEWFGDLQWMIARQNPADPDGFALAVKGGHNGEMHNQNDVGSFIVHYKRESLIAELGRGRYTRAYFGPERYSHFVTSSAGHSVPVVNGQGQLFGRQYHASVLEHTATPELDRLVLELKEAYPAEAGLESLKRSLTLYRTESRVELADTAEFSADTGKLESVLLTFEQAEVRPDSVEIRSEHAALRIAYNPAEVVATVETIKDVDLAKGPAEVRRLSFKPVHSGKTAEVRLNIQPLE